MLKFDHDKSEELDGRIMETLSSLLEDHSLAKGKHEFFLRERKVILELFLKVNEERRVLRSSPRSC